MLNEQHEERVECDMVHPQTLDPFTMFPSYKTIGIKDSLPIIASHMSKFF